MSDRSLRGMRLGAQSMETESGVEPAPRQRVEYRCEDGEQVFVTFSSEAEIPPVWVSKTGKEASWSTEKGPWTSNEKPVRTHWDMLLERRCVEELEQILEDRLTSCANAAANAAPPKSPASGTRTARERGPHRSTVRTRFLHAPAGPVPGWTGPARPACR